MLGAYRLLSRASGPLLCRLLERRLARGKENPDRIGERKGIPGLPRPKGRLVWVHAASVGEAVSSLVLIERLLAGAKDLSVLLTSGTVTSAEVIAKRLPERAFHQFAPLDHPAWVEGFLDHWKPNAAIWLESELWPNMLMAAHQGGVPLILANARLSQKSFRRWRRMGGMARRLMACFSIILPQTEGDADKYRALGAKEVRCLGNLKLAAAPLEADPTAALAMKQALGNRPVWLAASTHAGEETIIAEAHALLKAQYPGLLTIVAPRHPDRLQAVVEALTPVADGIAIRSRDDGIDMKTDFYIADTLGEMGLFYKGSRIALVGGSLVDRIGGHNPIEPAQLGCAVLFGRYMANFQDVERDMLAAQAAIQVGDAGDIAQAVSRLLSDPDTRMAAARNALNYVRQGDQILDGIVEAVNAQIERRGKGRHG